MKTFLVAACIAISLLSQSASAFAPNNIGSVDLQSLPKEAQQTLSLIKNNGRFPYSQDGVVFGNREAVLPKQKRGYYHEYTVKTPGVRTRGARRIIAGGVSTTSGEYYYTDDHYASFKRIKE